MDRFIKAAAVSLILLLIYYLFRRNKIIEAVSTNNNLKAFLSVIRYAEGTSGARGYYTLFGYEYIDTLAKHPNRKICKSNYCSTAAGAYQIIYSTWLECATAIGLTDFSEQSQDLAATHLIKKRGALELIEAGYFEEAISKLNKEWASLPGSPYGQPSKTISELKQVYLQHGGVVA